MNRRQVFIALAALGAPFSTSRAQHASRVRRIGFLGVGAMPSQAEVDRSPFRLALRKLGWVDGVNLVFDRRYAASEKDVRDLAAKVLKDGAEVIVVLNGTLANAVRKETQTVPIVTFAAGDLVAMGLVASLARPGGNVTGVQVLQTDLAGKRMSLLRELVPGLRQVTAIGGLAGEPGASGEAFFKNFESELMQAGTRLGIKAQTRFWGTAGPRAMLEELAAQRAQGVLVMGNWGTWIHREDIFEFARRSGVPTLCDTRRYAPAGCLASYGSAEDESGQRVAAIVDKLLKGAKAAELPVEQPTKFELVVNLKTAKALGITIPQSVQMRADEVIE